MALRFLTKLILLPVIVGIGYEFLMYAGRHDNLLIRILSTPGLWMQRITTKEPDLSQLEVAITALKCSMPEEFPDFLPDSVHTAEDENENGGAGEANNAAEAEETATGAPESTSEASETGADSMLKNTESTEPDDNGGANEN